MRWIFQLHTLVYSHENSTFKIFHANWLPKGLRTWDIHWYDYMFCIHLSHQEERRSGQSISDPWGDWHSTTMLLSLKIVWSPPDLHILPMVPHLRNASQLFSAHMSVCQECVGVVNEHNICWSFRSDGDADRKTGKRAFLWITIQWLWIFGTNVVCFPRGEIDVCVCVCNKRRIFIGIPI